MYSKVASDMNFPERERKIVEFWKENKIFEQSISCREGNDVYTFYDGPPTANGKPHIGHVLTRAIKDMIPRYRAMKGCKIRRKAGWDTHGLPVELEVEKLLGLDGKEQIEAYGMEPFIQKCKESVWKYKGMWEEFSGTVGFWADMDDPYVTYHDSYIESEWWALKEIWDKGLLYKGFKIVPYCPRCGTPLSSHEVAQGYKDVKEKSAIAKFRAKDMDNTWFLAWTTTPWTLPSNVALCVNAKERYVLCESEGEKYILAEALAPTVLPEGYTVLETYLGKDLEYKEYEPLFNFVQPKEKGWYVTCDDYVTLTDGTGIVHIAPAFGEDDANVGRNYKLPFVQLVNGKGEMTEETLWPGMFCKDADKEVLKNLKERGQLFAALPFEHSYPFCWRCDTPLIYYARESWFIQMTAVKDRLIANNNTINWIPESIGTGRFGNWLENVQDWGISRDRYWGTPLPIWQCECGHRHCIGSIEELKSMSDNCPDNIELHRPYIDAVTIKCPECGKQMTRVKEVIDCWFDSGAMPFAQWHYPFENKDIFEENFPADFISEAVDQTRGWFYSLLAISTLLFDKAPYKNVIVLGLVQDENGQKMSKSKGNAVDPMEALTKHGADAIRWYFYTNSAPWLPNRFYDKAVTEGQRRFISTLYNTYAFYVLYADIDEFDPTKYDIKDAALTVSDKWLLSRMNTMVKETDNALGSYKIPEAGKILDDFVDEMSNWYVRTGRSRFWASGMEADKIAAYLTLYTALVTVAKAAAPMIPFVTEEIYRNLVCSVDKNAPISIHLCDYPTYDEAMIDTALEAHMDEVLRVVNIGRAARNAASVKNRQPVNNLYVCGGEALDEMFVEIIKSELNTKNVIFEADAERFVSYTFKPNLRTLAPKLGKKINEFREKLTTIDGKAAMEELNSFERLTVALSDGDVVVARDDLLIETAKLEGFEAVQERELTVVLDTTLTEALIEEGYIRELVSKIQTMRKEADFVVTDHIRVYMAGNDKLIAIAEKAKADLLGDVLGDALVTGETQGYTKEWNVNGETVTLGVEKI